MTKNKKIAWESWNAKFETEEEDDSYIYSEQEENENDMLDLMPFDMFMPQQRVIHTPIGVYPEESMLKPSDRWDCWICHTNFDITSDIADKIEKSEGIEALKVLGRYSFFIGIAKMFDVKDVRRNIEQEICIYTEEEILSDTEIQKTVDLVKKQLQSSDYWSILVSPTGEVEYVSSNQMNKNYLDGLNNLIVLKNKIGGIILRGING
jgi:tRNA U54 and U55 pseudouridine synthase Pus10